LHEKGPFFLKQEKMEKAMKRENGCYERGGRLK
jgi:hypothetical protein